MNKYQTLNQTTANDCTVVALSILCNVSYDDALITCELAGREKNKGMYHDDTLKAYDILDVKLKEVFTHQLIYSKKGMFMSMKFNMDTGKGVIHDWTHGRKHRIIKMYQVLN